MNGFKEKSSSRPKEPIYETIPGALREAKLQRVQNYVSGPPPQGIYIL